MVKKKLGTTPVKPKVVPLPLLKFYLDVFIQPESFSFIGNDRNLPKDGIQKYTNVQLLFAFEETSRKLGKRLSLKDYIHTACVQLGQQSLIKQELRFSHELHFFQGWIPCKIFLYLNTS